MILLYTALNTLKKSLILILIISINLSCSNHYHYNQKIEKLFKLYNDSSQVNQLKALKYAKQASLLAENDGDSKGKTYSYIYIARSLFFMGYQKEGTEFMEKAAKEKYYKKDLVAQAMVKQIKHNNYNNINLESEGMRESLEIIELLKNEKSYEGTSIRLRATNNVAGYYRDKKEYDKAKYYLGQAEAIINKPIFNNRNINEDRSRLFIKKADIYFDLKNDSALYFYEKSIEVIKNDKNITKYVQYSKLGSYYYTLGNLQQALNYLLLSAEDMEFRKIEYSNFKLRAYFKISNIYEKLNNTKQAEIFQQKYKNENIKRLVNYNKNIQKSVEIILREKAEEQKYIRRNTWIAIISMSVFIVMFSIFAYKRHTKIKKQKDKIIEEQEEQTMILAQNIEENKFNELIKLVKVNNPQFLILFEELYPQFISKLKELDPKIRNSEISFCAMAYLNFSTKDIAEYTFVTTRAVEKHKSRIRKKYSIPSDENFNRWMKNIENNRSHFNF